MRNNESRVTRFYYEDEHNPHLVTEKVEHSGASTKMTYTDEGNLKTVEDAYNNVTTYVYAQELDTSPSFNERHRHLVREIHRPSRTVDNLEVLTPPTLLEYDIDGNLEKITDADGEFVEMTYFPDGLLDTITSRRGHTTELKYHSTNRNLLEVWTPSGPEGSITVRKIFLDYDEYSQVVSVKNGLDHESFTEYDLNGRVTKVTDARGKVSEMSYVEGSLVETTSPANNGSGVSRKSYMTYDSRGRLQSVLRDVGSISPELYVKYLYDGISRLTSLIRVKNNHERAFEFTHDALFRPVTSKDPEGGLSVINWESACVGRLEVSPRGIGRDYGVDLLCRVTQIRLGDPNLSEPAPGEELNPDLVHGMDNVREMTNFEYDELGRLTRLSQETSSIYGEEPGAVFKGAVLGVDLYGTEPEVQTEKRLYTYDNLDRLVSMAFRTNADESGNSDKTLNYEYDADGNVTRAIDTEEKATSYEYQRDGRLHKVIIERDSQPDRVFTYSYDPAGRLDSIEFPVGTGVVVKFDDGTETSGSGWDENGNLLHMVYEKNGVLLRRFEFTYDDSGNRASQLDVTPAKAVKWEYVYDWLDRLEIVKGAEASSVAGLPSTLPTISIFTYDASDNRIEFRVEQEDLTYRYEVDDADNLTKVYLQNGSDPESLVETFGHDADGNMIMRANVVTGEVTDYEWNDSDRLIRVSTSIGGTPTSRLAESNRYDSSGIRKRKLDRNGNSSLEYTADIITAASKAGTSSSQTPTISYVMGHQILGAEVNGNFQFFLTDALGTVRDVIDDSGDVVQSYEFDEHGIPMPGSGAASGTFSPKTYQGALSVNDDRNDSGLYLMGHRHYAPELGRFISRDPIGFAGGLNLFAGAGVNPVTFVDPTGLREFTVGGMTISVMLNDADPLPSDPHGHIESGRYAGHKIDLSTGQITSTTKGHVGEVIGSLSKKELRDFQGKLDKAYGSGMMVKTPCKNYVKPLSRATKVFSILGVPFKILDAVGTAQEIGDFCETVREGRDAPLKIPTLYNGAPRGGTTLPPGTYMIGPSMFQVQPYHPSMDS